MDIKHDRLIASCPGIIFVIDLTGKLVFLAGALEKSIGFRPEDLRGMPFSDIVCQDNQGKLRWLPPPSNKLGALRTLELDLLTKDDKRKSFLFTYHYVDTSALGLFKSEQLPKSGSINALYGIATIFDRQKFRQRVFKNTIKRLVKEKGRARSLCLRLINEMESQSHNTIKYLWEEIAEPLGALKIETDLFLRKVLDQAPKPGLAKVRQDLTAKVAALLGRVKEKIYNLRPEIIDTLGLEPALRVLCEQASQETGIQIDLFGASIPAQLSPEKRIALYRIVESALNKLSKVRKATEVFITLLTKDKRIVLTYEDNGSVIDPLISPNEEIELEILLMNERTVNLGGKFYMDFKSGFGVFLRVELPI